MHGLWVYSSPTPCSLGQGLACCVHASMPLWWEAGRGCEEMACWGRWCWTVGWTVWCVAAGRTVFCVGWCPHAKSVGCLGRTRIMCCSCLSCGLWAVWPGGGWCRAVHVPYWFTRRHAAQRHACLPCAMVLGLKPMAQGQHPCRWHAAYGGRWSVKCLGVRLHPWQCGWKSDLRPGLRSRVCTYVCCGSDGGGAGVLWIPCQHVLGSCGGDRSRGVDVSNTVQSRSTVPDCTSMMSPRSFKGGWPAWAGTDWTCMLHSHSKQVLPAACCLLAAHLGGVTHATPAQVHAYNTYIDVASKHVLSWFCRALKSETSASLLARGDEWAGLASNAA